MLRSGALANRDFRLLFAGRSVSLLGDGAFLVALAWQAYTLSNAPTALSFIGIAMTVPTIALLLFGGVVSDRHSRRRVMLLADVMRAVLLALLGALALTGTLKLWHMMVIVALYGSAQAFFDPASDAILPELLPEEQLGQANALEQVVRPLALRLAGPALGGVLVGVFGPGSAFLADGATFVASALALSAMSARAVVAAPEIALQAVRATGAELREGWVYVRRHVWLWGTFASAGIAYLLFMGPAEVLLPFMVKHVLGGSGVQLGLVLGAGGLGSVACALAMARSGLPARGMTFIYVVWALATLAVAGYGLASAIWQLMLASLAFNLLETAGTIVWATIKQRHVPGHMLGRVSSLDWLISIGLLPVSFALTAPLSATLGVRATLIGAGLAGAAATLGGLMLPGMRAADRTMSPAGRGAIAAPPIGESFGLGH
ncbi:MAG TPA: MFS transporter [Solirubrobacteraceae bacterium]|jgi:MFS family permease|nr:MFS transporter [Solirubrobacteraceae bacterium]